MKWFSFPCAMMVVVLVSPTTKAELLSRVQRLFDYHGPIISTMDGPTLAVSADGAAAPLPNPQAATSSADPYAGSVNGYGFGCCEKDISYARSLWSGYCLRRDRLHGRLVGCCKSLKTSCSTEAACCEKSCGLFDFHWRSRACCKPRMCLPKFDFHWAGWRCCKPACDDSYVAESACCQKSPWRYKMFGWMRHGLCCDECGLDDCDGCAKQVSCRRHLSFHRMFAWMHDGCSDCAMTEYEGGDGEIWSDAEEVRAIDSPPMPEPQIDSATTPISDKEVRQWSLPQSLKLFPAKIGL